MQNDNVLSLSLSTTGHNVAPYSSMPQHKDFWALSSVTTTTSDSRESVYEMNVDVCVWGEEEEQGCMNCV